MNGIWIALSKTVTQSEVASELRRQFPSVTLMARDEAMAIEGSWPPIVFSVDSTLATDFPVVVAFDCFPGNDNEAVAVANALARNFAATYQCRSLTDGSGYGDDQSPYWCILWEGAQAYLADDCNTAFADGEGGNVKIVRPILIVVQDLDSVGRLAQSSLFNSGKAD